MDETNSKRLKTEGRVCLLTSNFPRWDGDATTPFVLHLAQDLIKLGWQVEVLAPHAAGAARHEILHGVPVWRFRYLWPASQQTVCYQGGALINLRMHRTNWLKLPLLVFFEWLALMALLLRRRYDLINAHWILPQGLVAAAAGRLYRVPVVITAHGSDVFGLRGWPMAWFKRSALRCATAVTVNSSATEAEVLRIAPGLQCVHRIPMGITGRIPAVEAAGGVVRGRYRRGHGPLLVFVGRLVEEKGVDDLIRAVAIVADALPDVTAIILGEGPDRPRMEALSAELGVGDRIVFLGWMQPDAVPDYLSAADVFVGPSKRAKSGGVEGQGLTFIEAMLAGTPVIATRSGGIVDAVQDGRTGLLVSENEPEEIAAAIRRLVRNPELAQRLAARGREMVMSEFSRETTAHAFNALFAARMRR